MERRGATSVSEAVVMLNEKAFMATLTVVAIVKVMEVAKLGAEEVIINDVVYTTDFITALGRRTGKALVVATRVIISGRMAATDVLEVTTTRKRYQAVEVPTSITNAVISRSPVTRNSTTSIRSSVASKHVSIADTGGIATTTCCGAG